MRVERRLKWSGVAFGVKWVFRVFWAEMGVQVFVVKRGVCWVFGGEMGVGLRSWVFCEYRGGIGGAGDGCGCVKRRKGSYWSEKEGVGFWLGFLG